MGLGRWRNLTTTLMVLGWRVLIQALIEEASKVSDGGSIIVL
jgi:hypothetical protein